MSTDQDKQLSKPEPQHVTIPMVNGALVPQDDSGLWRLASLFHRAGILPFGVKTPEQVCIAIMAGTEAGLTPTQAMQNVMVVNNRPTIWGDAAIGLVWASGKMESHSECIEGDGDKRAGVCTVKRKGDEKPHTVRFSVDDAIKARLWKKDGPWSQYPDRMLKLRARAFAIRDKFADVLKGLGVREEVEDIPYTPRQIVAEVITPGRPSLAERLAAEENDAPDAGAGSAPPALAPTRQGENAAPPKHSNGRYDDQGNLIEESIDDVMKRATDVAR